jgi:hypothetical protein
MAECDVATPLNAPRRRALRRVVAAACVLAAGCAGAWAAAPGAKAAEPIDINSATRAQLRTLPGIGSAEADRIVAGRPYFSKADLATRDVLPTGVYLSLKDRVIARQKIKPRGRTP